MAGTPTDSIEAAMASMQRLADPSPVRKPAAANSGAKGRAAARPAKKRRRWFRTLAWGTLLAGAGLVLPFAVLLRVSMYGYQDQLLHPWLAVAGGVGAATVGLMAYGFTGTRLLGFRPRFSSGTAKVLLASLAVYCGYATLYISAANVKTPAVQATYTELHPLLRLSVSTLVLADGDLVVTDAARQAEDYSRMGLPVNEASLHLRQTDGYVHALDLRTIGRAEWKNRLMVLYFKAFGFRTLRHTGTADHLHVSLGVSPMTIDE